MKATILNIENLLESLKRMKFIPKEIEIKKDESRSNSKRIALCVNTENSFWLKTGFMTVNEMNCFLSGIYFISQKRI